MAIASAIRRHSCCFTAAQLAEKHIDRAMEILSTQQPKLEPDEDEGSKNQNNQNQQQKKTTKKTKTKKQQKKQQMMMMMMEESLSALEAALEICPGHDRAMELKARTLLNLRRFTEVIAMLHDDVPSLQNHLISTTANPNSAIDNSLVGRFDVASPASSVSSSNCSSCIIPSSGELLTASSSSSSSSSSASSASSSASSDHLHHHRRTSSRDEKGKLLPDYKTSLVNISEPGSEPESEAGFDEEEEEDSNAIAMKKHDTCFSVWSLLSSNRLEKQKIKKEQKTAKKQKKKKKKNQTSKMEKKEQQWRYLVLGQACWYLGMLEDAMVLLQRSKRRASAVSRWQSNCMREDNFCSDQLCRSYYILGRSSSSPSPSSSSFWSFSAQSRVSWSEHSSATEAELVTQILGSIKFLLRRRTAAMAALEAGLYTESARHFSKIIDQGRARGTPQAFVADCYLHRAIAYQATGRVVDAIADCNRSLALIPHCTKALSVRASLYEMVRCFSECLLDLQQLKMIYEASLRRQRMNSHAEDCRSSSSSSSMVFHHASESYGDLSGGLEYVNSKISATRQRLSGANRHLDAHTILELPLNCSREDVERAYLLISLKHRAEKAAHFIDKCESMDDDRDMESVREEATASATRLTQLIYKAYLKLLSAIAEEDEEKKASYRRRSYGMMAKDSKGVDMAMASAGGRSSDMAMAAVLSSSRNRIENEEDEDEEENEEEEEIEEDEDECDFCEPFTADVAGALLSEPHVGDTSPPLSTWAADWTTLAHPHPRLLRMARC